MNLALYLHIPFCVKKCRYCAFNSIALPQNPQGRRMVSAYLEALSQEIAVYKKLLGKAGVATLYFGGGTPTFLSAEELNFLLKLCRDSFQLDPEAEISLEANPGTVTSDKLRDLRQAGFNRISIGAQSFNPEELQLLGRIHDVSAIYSAVADARRAGFENINLDLIYGLPEQTLEKWQETLYRTLELQPRHISVYGLMYEEGTPLTAEVEAGLRQICNEELQVKMWEEAEKLFTTCGFQRYEIANYAQPGRECRHNLAYWHNLSYLGIGAGAHGYLEAVRYANHAELGKYIKIIREGRLPRDWEEKQTPELERKDTIIMGLRLRQGISKRVFQERFGVSFEELYAKELEFLRNEDLLKDDGENFYLSARGKLLANQVLCYFV